MMLRDNRKYDRLHLISITDANVIALHDLFRIGTRIEHLCEHILRLAARDLLLLDKYCKVRQVLRAHLKVRKRNAPAFINPRRSLER